MALSFDTLAATTLDNYRDQLTDNVFDSHPVLFHLKDKGRVRMVDGGNSIVEPVIHTDGDTVQTYEDYDAITITPVETATAAQFDWRAVAATIAISGMEEAKNNGEAAVVNLLEAKIMQAEETMKNKLSSMLFAATPGAKDIESLLTLIDDSGTVGGIAVADMPTWASVVQDKTAVAYADVDIRAFVRNAYNTASKGGPDGVDLVVATQNLFERYEEDLLATVRRTQQKMADAGFQNLEVQGVPMVWDWNAPAGTILGINSKYLGFVGHSDRWFKQSKFTEGLSAADGGVATTVDARYSVITAFLALTTRNRRRHFKIENIDETP